MAVSGSDYSQKTIKFGLYWYEQVDSTQTVTIFSGSSFSNMVSAKVVTASWDLDK